MANPSVKGGLKFAYMINGEAPGGTVPACTLTADTTQIGIGDAVKLSGTGNNQGIASITRAAAGDRIFGVVEGVLPDTSGLISEGTKYRVTATARNFAVRVADNLSVFEIQEDNVGGNLANTSIGLYCNLIVSNCDTTSGLSNMKIDSGTGITGSGQLRLVGFVQRSDNDITTTNGKWLVMVATSQVADSAGSV